MKVLEAGDERLETGGSEIGAEQWVTAADSKIYIM